MTLRNPAKGMNEAVTAKYARGSNDSIGLLNIARCLPWAVKGEAHNVRSCRAAKVPQGHNAQFPCGGLAECFS